MFKMRPQAFIFLIARLALNHKLLFVDSTKCIVDKKQADLCCCFISIYLFIIFISCESLEGSCMQMNFICLLCAYAAYTTLIFVCRQSITKIF